MTNVLYGTTWDDSTLLEKMKQTNLELERRDGIQRHFRYDCQVVGQYNSAYLQHVENERQRLGDNHPLFLTQYCLLPIHGGGGFLNSTQRAQLQGEHLRLSHPEESIVIDSGMRSLAEPRMSRPRSPSPNPMLAAANRIAGTLQGAESVGDPGAAARSRNSKVYVAGIDLAGEAESAEDDFLKSIKPRQDSTVITIAELETIPSFPLTPDLKLNTSNFKLKIIQHYSFTGVKHPDLYRRIIDLLHNVWHCRWIMVICAWILKFVCDLYLVIFHRIVSVLFYSIAETITVTSVP